MLDDDDDDDDDICDGKFEDKCIYPIYSFSPSPDTLSGGEREKLAFLNIWLRQSGKQKEADSLTFNPRHATRSLCALCGDHHLQISGPQG